MVSWDRQTTQIGHEIFAIKFPTFSFAITLLKCSSLKGFCNEREREKE